MGARRTAGFARLVAQFTCGSPSGAGNPLHPADGPKAAVAAAWEISAFRLPTGLPATRLRPGLGGWPSALHWLGLRRPPLLPCPCPCLSCRPGLLTSRLPRGWAAPPAAGLPRPASPSSCGASGEQTLPLPSESPQGPMPGVPALEELREVPGAERWVDGSPRVAHLPRGSRIPSSSRYYCSCPRSPRASPAATPAAPRTSARRSPPARTPESG